MPLFDYARRLHIRYRYWQHTRRQARGPLGLWVELHKLNDFSIEHAEAEMHANAESKILRISRGRRV